MKARTSFILFVLIALGIIAALVYEIWTIKSLRQEAAIAVADTQEKLGVDGWSRSIRSIQIDEKANLDTIDQSLLTRTGLVNLIELLESTGKNLGLDITISSVRDDPKQKTQVTITVDTNGPWEPSFRYLHFLESLPYQVNIENSILNSEDGKWHSTATLRITLAPENIQQP